MKNKNSNASVCLLGIRRITLVCLRKQARLESFVYLQIKREVGWVGPDSIWV